MDDVVKDVNDSWEGNVTGTPTIQYVSSIPSILSLLFPPTFSFLLSQETIHRPQPANLITHENTRYALLFYRCVFDSMSRHLSLMYVIPLPLRDAAFMLSCSRGLYRMPQAIAAVTTNATR